jgi:cytoskeletal protein CcmA (bactofilin family)
MRLSFGTARRRGVVVVLVVVLLFSTVTGVAAAQSVRGASGTIVVEEGQTVSSVDALAGSILVRGTVTGDVSGAAGTIHVAEGGRVGGSISGAAGDVRIDGEVGGDVTAGSGNVQVTETATIGGDVEIGAGYVRINGRIDGDVRVGAETIVIGPNAEVGGEFRYDADDFTQDPEATVAGGVVEDPDLRGNVGTFALPNWVSWGYGLLANLLLGAILLVLFPAFSARLAGRVSDEPAKTGGVGLLTLVGGPILLALVAITIIGIPLAVLGAIAFGLAIWAGAVYGQYAVGAWALRRAGRDDRWLALVAGIVGFAILGAIPVLGGFLAFGALLLGLGALALELWDSFRTRRRSGPSDRQTTFDESFSDSQPGYSTERTTDGQ